MNNREHSIEQYLLDELTEHEKTEFEAAMVSDPALRHRVEHTRQIITAFEKRAEGGAFGALSGLSSEEQLKDIILRAEQKNVRSGLRRSNLARRYYLWGAVAAAAAVVLVIIGVQPEYSSETLYADYFVAGQQYEITPNRGADGLPPEAGQQVTMATESFHEGEYATAAKLYSAALTGVDKGDVREDILLYYGISLSQAGQDDRAVDILFLIAGDDDAELQDAARWNLSLLLLKEGKRKQAIETLEILSNDGGDYTAQASELKAKIKKRRWF